MSDLLFRFTHAHLAVDDSLNATPLVGYLSAELGDDAAAEVLPNLRVSQSGSVSHDPDTRFGITGGMQNGRFVVPDTKGHWCAFDPSSLEVGSGMSIDLDLCCAAFSPGVLLDWIAIPALHFAVAAAGGAALHASAATLPPDINQPVVFTAWSGVGKTNLVLWAAARAGGYFGDDQVVVDERGCVHPSTRRISVYGYNEVLARGSLTLKQRTRLAGANAVHRAAWKGGGTVGSRVTYLANALGSARVHARELGASSAEPSAAMSVVVCRSTQDEHVHLERATESPAQLAAAHIAVMEYEYVWFRRYLTTWRWAVASQRDPWQELAARWQSNLTHFFAAVPDRYSLGIPHGEPASIAPMVWRAVTSASRG